jgi:hypothetical protein
MSDELAAWEALGPVLQLLVDERRGKVITYWQDHLSLVLRIAGIAEEEVKPRPLDLTDADFVFAAAPGALGSVLRSTALQLEVARELQNIWQSVTDREEEEPWAAFWSEVADLMPEQPDAALEIGDGVRDPASLWPLEDTGETESAIVGQALDDVAARTGIPRAQLPPTPVLPDRPALRALPEYDAVYTLHLWFEEREAWARMLGHLGPALRRAAS